MQRRANQQENIYVCGAWRLLYQHRRGCRFVQRLRAVYLRINATRLRDSRTLFSQV
jgi:hypothetical protein